MYRNTTLTLLALLGLAAGSAQASYCTVSTYDASNLRLFNYEFPGITMKVDGGFASLRDPEFGCTMQISVRPDQGVEAIVTELPPQASWAGYTHFDVPPMTQIGSDSVVFRRIEFPGTDTVRRELTFRLDMRRHSTWSESSTSIVGTYTETTASGRPILERVVRFENDGSTDFWMRVDWDTNSGTNDTSLGSMLQVRFIETDSERVLSGTAIALPAGAAPRVLHQGMLGSNGVLDETISICTAFPGYLSGDFLVPPSKMIDDVCRA
jgi:hypothetical protein